MKVKSKKNFELTTLAFAEATIWEELFCIIFFQFPLKPTLFMFSLLHNDNHVLGALNTSNAY